VRLLAIDPGPETCGVVLLDVDEFPPRVIRAWSEMPVARLLKDLKDPRMAGVRVAAERITGYGKEVGASTFLTCEVFGKIDLRCADVGLVFADDITRKVVKTRLGLPTTATEAQVNAVMRHTYPATGGGSTPAVGTKAKPGPLYKIRHPELSTPGEKIHTWAALGVGLAWCLEQERERRAAELAELTRQAG
jgi:hypothetical protein